jgi:hypothetical protein
MFTPVSEEDSEVVTEDVTFTCQDVEYCEDYEYRYTSLFFQLPLSILHYLMKKKISVCSWP